MIKFRVAVVSHSDVFAAGIRQMLTATGEFEVVRASGTLTSLRRYAPLQFVVLDSDAMARLNLQKLLSIPELPEVRVVCVDQTHNRAVMYARGEAEIRCADDLAALLLSRLGAAPTLVRQGGQEV